MLQTRIGGTQLKAYVPQSYADDSKNGITSYFENKVNNNVKTRNTLLKNKGRKNKQQDNLQSYAKKQGILLRNKQKLAITNSKIKAAEEQNTYAIDVTRKFSALGGDNAVPFQEKENAIFNLNAKEKAETSYLKTNKIAQQLKKEYDDHIKKSAKAKDMTPSEYLARNAGKDAKAKAIATTLADTNKLAKNYLDTLTQYSAN